MGKGTAKEFPLKNVKLAPTTQTKTGDPTAGIADASITTAMDGATLTSGQHTVAMYPSMQDPSAILGALNGAGIAATIDRAGRLVLTDATVAPTSNDANLLKALGLS